jgi:hypothetical protein
MKFTARTVAQKGFRPLENNPPLAFSLRKDRL